jgi:hypothetical protein
MPLAATGLHRIDDSHALAGAARLRPVIELRIDVVRLDRAQHRFAGVQLVRDVEVAHLAARTAGMDFRPDRTRQRFHRIVELESAARAHEGGEVRQLALGGPARHQ